MSDRITTLRSDYYKRPFPFTGAKPTSPEEVGQRQQLIAQHKAGKATPQDIERLGGKWFDDYLAGVAERKAKGEKEKDLRTQRAEALLATNPKLKPLLQKVALARIAMLNAADDDEMAHSKKYGWGHKIDYKNAPQDSEYFKLNYDPDTGEIWVEDTDAALNLLDPSGKADMSPMYKQLRKEFEDYANEPYTQTFVPATRDEAKEKGYDWYPSTQEFLNALIETQLGDGNKQALYDATQNIFSELMADDRRKETPEFQRAWERILLDDGSGRQKPQFVAPNGVAEFGKNMVIPFFNAVYSDPELWQKTGTGEAVARGIADAGLNTASIVLPWAGAARGATMGSRPLIGAMIGGAAGGNANYWLKRLANEGFDLGTGHGGLENPIDLTDMGIETVAGSLAGVGAAANRVKGMRQLQRKMKPANPSAVKGDDIKASIDLSKQYGSKANAEWPFRSDAFTGYEKAYPNGGYSVKKIPALEAEATDDLGTKVIPLAQDLPSGSAARTGRVKGTGANANKFIDSRMKTTNPATGKPYEVVTEWMTPDAEFMKAYIGGRNKAYFDKLLRQGGDFGDLQKAAKKAQEKDNPLTEYFGNGRRTFSNKDMAARLASLSGEHFDDESRAANKFVARALRNDRQVMNKVDGKWKKGDQKQVTAHTKAMDKYKNRADMNLVDETDKKTAFRNGKLTGALKLPIIGNTAVSNAIPWGSNAIFGVSPYTYEIEEE